MVILTIPALAQNEEDALRYSQLFDAGATARSMSMGGAFGALGADLSAMSINPAGIAVFRRSVFVFTPSYMYDKTRSNYLGNKDYDTDTHFSLGNLGYVYTYNTGRDQGWVSMSFGGSYYNRTDYNRNINITGVNDNNSMLDFFADKADNNIPDNFDAYSEGLAYNTWLIDTVNGQPMNYETVLSQYGDNANSTYGQLQKRILQISGRNSEYNFSFAANYGYSLYIGGTFTIRTLDYKRHMKHSEEDVDNSIYDFHYFDYHYYLSTRGKAYGFSLGLIYKPVQMIRLGASVHLPSVYKLHDDYSSSIEAGYDTPDANGNTVYSDDSPDGYYDYRLTTPLRFTGSVGLQFLKLALFSIDYEYIDYSGMKLRSEDYDFSDENSAIHSAYRAAHNIRTGAEVRLGPFSLRGGLAYYDSPYRSTELNKNATSLAYTTGIGLKDRHFSFDLGYMYFTHQEKYVLYPNYQGDYADNQTSSSRIAATFMFSF